MACNQTEEQSPTAAEESDNSATETDTGFETESDAENDTEAEIAATSQPYPSPEATYEEVVGSAQLFSDNLKAFHSSYFCSEIRYPTLGGKELDLYRLFVEVTSRGGVEKVIRDRKWKEVVSALNFPPTVSNASFVVRKHYISLLYHFEQAYFFRRTHAAISVAAPKSESPVTGMGFTGEPAAGGQIPENPTLRPGISVIGTIDGKCEYGYAVSVNLGSEQLKGILYHTPNIPQTSSNVDTSIIQHQKRKRRRRQTPRDPAKPKLNRSAYNFFFAEQNAKLEPLYLGQERGIVVKEIGRVWTGLSEAEKQVYQEKARQDKERYNNEMLKYLLSRHL